MRKLKFVERGSFAGWVCSDCGWEFRPSDDLSGAASTFDALVNEFRSLRDEAFAKHVCASQKKPKPANARGMSHGK
jgi:hypothetical protein